MTIQAFRKVKHTLRPDLDHTGPYNVQKQNDIMDFYGGERRINDLVTYGDEELQFALGAANQELDEDFFNPEEIALLIEAEGAGSEAEEEDSSDSEEESSDSKEEGMDVDNGEEQNISPYLNIEAVVVPSDNDTNSDSSKRKAPESDIGGSVSVLSIQKTNKKKRVE